MTEQQPVAVLGGGSFGTAIANLLAANGQRVLQWMRDPEQAEAMRTQRENPRYLKGIKLLPGAIKWGSPKVVIPVVTCNPAVGGGLFRVDP